MRPIPLNLMTLYADLLQNAGAPAARGGSLALKTIKGRKFYYHTLKDGASRVERYLGPADDIAVQDEVAAIRAASKRDKARRSTVTLLKAARVAAPTLVQGRILEVIANAGLFARGLTLVGTVAYQIYPWLLGAYLEASALATNDIDLSAAEFVAAGQEENIEEILKRADPTFRPVWHAEDKLPRIFRSADFQVDIVTSFRRGRKSPVLVESLGCAAAALTFQEYAAEDTIEAIALYGTGITVRIPSPARFAIHKLLVARRRPVTEEVKRRKDLKQAAELIDILLETDDMALIDALDDARLRGPSWKSGIDASLKSLGRNSKAGHPPTLLTPPARMS